MCTEKRMKILQNFSMIRRKNPRQEYKEKGSLRLWQSICTKTDISDDALFYNNQCLNHFID